MKDTYRIFEYGSFVRDRHFMGYEYLPADVFDALENFVLSNSGKSEDVLDLMTVSVRKGAGKVITAKNYVGIITMKDGSTIEILPKVYSVNYLTSNTGEEAAAKSKNLLIEMLKTLKEAPFKSVQTSSMSVEKMNILEIFIRMFIDEVFLIAKKGLKCGYETIQANENFFKGKIKFSEHIKHNYAHKERSFVEYDDFNYNRVENKILKATLLYLYKQTTSMKNKNDIKTLLYSFVDVDVSTDYEKDFSKIVEDRNTKDYETALKWAQVFLKGKSFTSYSGSEVAMALLFPMETLFESYVTAMMRKEIKNSDYSATFQDRTKYLFDSPRKQFLIKPDILIKRKSGDAVYVLDTKWKILSERFANYGISQTDMYQMYAYQKKYGAEHVTLIYPYSENIEKDKEIEFSYPDDALVRVKFVDLFNIKESVNRIVESL